MPRRERPWPRRCRQQTTGEEDHQDFPNTRRTAIRGTKPRFIMKDKTRSFRSFRWSGKGFERDCFPPVNWSDRQVGLALHYGRKTTLAVRFRTTNGAIRDDPDLPRNSGTSLGRSRTRRKNPRSPKTLAALPISWGGAVVDAFRNRIAMRHSSRISTMSIELFFSRRPGRRVSPRPGPASGNNSGAPAKENRVNGWAGECTEGRAGPVESPSETALRLPHP